MSGLTKNGEPCTGRIRSLLTKYYLFYNANKKYGIRIMDGELYLEDEDLVGGMLRLQVEKESETA